MMNCSKTESAAPAFDLADKIVVTSADFVKRYGELRLSNRDMERVAAAINRLRNNFVDSSLCRIEPVAGAPGDEGFLLMTVPTTRDPLSVVLALREPMCLVLWIGACDEAIAWAAKRRCVVDPDVGLRLYEAVEPLPDAETDADAPLFADLDDDQLRGFGVPDDQIPFLRSVTSREQLDAAADSFPFGVYENLSFCLRPADIAADSDGAGSVQDPLPAAADDDEAILSPVEPVDEPADDAPYNLERLVSNSGFTVVNGETELERILEYPLETWRVFLHPTQRKIVEKTFSGPARVLGGAGVGKTVVAMHRARRLAAGLCGDQRVLFTTFTANLAMDVKANLRKICSEAEYKRIDVVHLDAWVKRYLDDENYKVTFVYDDVTLLNLWDDAIDDANVDLGFSADFYRDEWERVMLTQKSLSKNEYLAASRVGRGVRLDRVKKLAVWKVFDSYINLMKDRRVRDIGTAMIEAASMIREKGENLGFAHVIVDEAQDLGNPAFRLLRAIAGEPHPDDLFIVGDGKQRIYKNRPVLSRCGVEIRGRSSNLRLNYRTTEETRKFAYALLDGLVIDDLDDGRDYGGPCLSLTHGPAPEIVKCATEREEIEFIASQISALRSQNAVAGDSAVPALSSFCVVLRTNALAKKYAEELEKYYPEFTPVVINPKEQDDRRRGGVRFATMHRVKGLEFQYIFLASVNADVTPPKGVEKLDNPVAKREIIAAERRLFYVALTRAQKAAYVSCSGKISSLFENV